MENEIENKIEYPLCGLSEMEVDALKQEHGAVIMATVKQGGDIHHAIFKEPTIKVIEMVDNMQKSNPTKASMNLYNNCILAADESFDKRDLLKIEAVKSIGKHIKSFSEEVKNL